MSTISVPCQATLTWKQLGVTRSSIVIPGRRGTCFLGRRKITDVQKKREPRRSFVTGTRLVFQWEVVSTAPNRRPKGFRSPSAFGFTGPQIAVSLGTIVVIPFYSLMILSPNAPITKKTMECSMHYVVLGVLYAYLLYLSWTPEKLQLLFPNKYFIPEIEGIAKMFSNEMTLASAWIHLLVVDLFAARHIYLDGLKNKVETRHSVLMCLFSCPIGLISHVITKLLFKTALSEKSNEDN